MGIVPLKIHILAFTIPAYGLILTDIRLLQVIKCFISILLSTNAFP